MEKWCPGDVGRGIVGIGLGHLLGREHDSTLQSVVVAPRLLKKSLSRLYYCYYFFRHRLRGAMCLSTQLRSLIDMPPRSSGLTSGMTPDVSVTGTQRPTGRSPKMHRILR